MSHNKDFVMKSILTMYGMEFEPDQEIDEQKILLEVGMNAANTNSLHATVFAARENARSVRYIISTELWEVINEYYLFVKEYNADFYKTRGLYDFTVSVSKHCSIVRSYLDHTLVHDEIWVFICLGIYLERASQIIRILKSKLQDIEILTEHGANLPLLRYQWTITLKVLEAFDMHRRLYRKPQTQKSVFEFLTSNALFPRSIAYNLECIHSLVSKLSMFTKSGDMLTFKAGKISSYFQYLEYAEIKDDLHTFLDQSLDRIYEVHTLIEEEYFQTST